ncbi:MAG: MAPEG family protein [Marinibacterium sp.]
MPPVEAPELFWLACNTVLTALLVIPYAAYRVGKLGGLGQVFLNPLPGDAPFDDDWAHRAYRTHMNAFEAIALFAPAALVVHVTGIATPGTALASAIFFWARLAYAPMFWFSVPILRTAIWFTGFGATLYIAVHAIVALI